MKRKIIEIIYKNYDVVGGAPKLRAENIASEILDLFGVSKTKCTVCPYTKKICLHQFLFDHELCYKCEKFDGQTDC